MAEPGKRVAPLDPGVGDDDFHPVQAPLGLVDLRGPRPRRYLSDEPAHPQTKIAVDTTIRTYQRTICQVSRSGEGLARLAAH